MLKGIDVSHWQGENFNFTKAKENGYEWACLKAGGGSDDHTRYTDVCFLKNYASAIKSGITHISAYYFGHDKTVESAKNSAKYLWNLVKDLPSTSYLFYDVEGEMLSVEKSLLTDIILSFCNTVNALAGNNICGIYTSESHYNSLIDDSKLKLLPHWVAKYSNTKPQLKSGNNVDIWQYSAAENEIWGFPVDVNNIYIELPNFYSGLTFDIVVENTYKGVYGNGRTNRKEQIEALGFDYEEVQNAVNERYYGISSTVSPKTDVSATSNANSTKKTVEEMAALVYRGDFGNGAVRKANIEALGYDYEEVRKAVNRIYYGITV